MSQSGRFALVNPSRVSVRVRGNWMLDSVGDCSEKLDGNQEEKIALIISLYGKIPRLFPY